MRETGGMGQIDEEDLQAVSKLQCLHWRHKNPGRPAMAERKCS